MLHGRRPVSTRHLEPRRCPTSTRRADERSGTTPPRAGWWRRPAASGDSAPGRTRGRRRRGRRAWEWWRRGLLRRRRGRLRRPVRNGREAWASCSMAAAAGNPATTRGCRCKTADSTWIMPVPSTEHLLQPHGGANHSRILAVVRLSAAARAATRSRTGMGMEMAGVPKAVHGAFIRGSPVDARPNGAGPGGGRHENDRCGLVQLCHAGLAFGDIPPRLVVACGWDLETVANQVGQIREARPMFLEALLMKSSGLVRLHGVARVGEPRRACRRCRRGEWMRPRARSTARVF